MRNGGHFFSQFVDEIGNSTNDPFTVVYGDLGVSTTGVKVNTPLFTRAAGNVSTIATHVVKFDGMGARFGIDSAEGVASKRFVKIVNDSRYKRELTPLFLESAICDDTDNTWGVFVSYSEFTLVGVNGGTGTGSVGGKDPQCAKNRMHHITFKGEGTKVAKLSGWHVINLTDHDTLKDGIFNGPVTVSKANNGKAGLNNVIENITFGGTINDNKKAQIHIEDGIINTTLRNLTFTNADRKDLPLIYIGTGSDVTATNICAPGGSTIAGLGTLILNGDNVNLPYTIQAGDCKNPN